MGDLQAARRKAEQAAKYNVAYSPFDDRPELVLESIGIREAQTGRGSPADFGVEQAGAQSGPSVAGDGSDRIRQANAQALPGAESAAVHRTKKERANALVRSARADLKHGRIEAARRKAKQAVDLAVTYSIMEDRPELILADIERREPSQSIAGSGTPGAGGAAAALRRRYAADSEPLAKHEHAGGSRDGPSG